MKLTLLLVSILLSFVIVISYDFQSLTTGQSQRVTLLSCQRLFFKWTLQNPSSRVYLTVNATTPDVVASGLTIWLSNVQPNETNPQTIDCANLQCTVGLGNSCEFDSCFVETDDWYIWIEHSSDNDVDVVILPSINQLPDPTAITVDGSPIDSTSIVSRDDNYDFYQLNITTNNDYVPGTTLAILVTETNQVDPDNPYRFPIYLNYGKKPAFPQLACQFTRFGSARLEIQACPYAKGGTWQITVARETILDRTYQIQAFTIIPEIKSIDNGENTVQYLSLASTIYFEYQQEHSGSVIDVAVSNVYGGEISVQVSKRYLPNTDCTLQLKTCTASVGCHIHYDMCETANAQVWYIAVNATTTYHPSEQLEFTIIVEESQPTDENIDKGSKVTGTVRREEYSYYHYDVPSDWFRVHVYIDASKNPVPPQNAYLYLSPTQYAGNPCYSYDKTCVLTTNTNDLMSCSIQLDPCEISSKYKNGIYASVYANDEINHNFYYSQEKVSFTLESYEMSPPNNKLEMDTLATRVVAAAQYEIFRVDPFSGAAYITVTSGQQNSATNDLTVMVFFTDSLSAPSCSCWNPNIVRTVTRGGFVTIDISACQTASTTGLYIVVQASLDFDFYVDRKFVVSIAKSTAVNSAFPQLQDLSSNVEHIDQLKDGELHRYRLEHHTDNLNEKTLVITFRGHMTANQRATLYAYTGDGESCTSRSELNNCAPANSEGYCTIAQRGCNLIGYDSYLLVAEVSESGSSIKDSEITYSLSYDWEDISPIGLKPDIFTTSLMPYMYQHYTLNVDNSDIGMKTLIVEAWVDAGQIRYENEPLHLFVNSPNQNRPAGEVADCLCYEQNLSNLRKVLFLVNACKLVAGQYHFSLYTDSLAYSTTPVPVTVHSRFVEVLRKEVELDTPVDLSLYPLEIGVVPLTIPIEMTTNKSDTEKILTIRVMTTRLEDAVSFSLSTDLPSACNCALSSFDCTQHTEIESGKIICDITLDYCQLQASNSWYISLQPIEYLDDQNPVPFTLEITKYNHQKSLETLAVSETVCTAQDKEDTLIPANSVHYYEIGYNYQSPDDVVEVHVENITDPLDIYVSKDDIATYSCPTPTTPYNCLPDNSCIIRLTCGIKYLTIYPITGRTTSYKISSCLQNDIKTLSLGTPINGNLAALGENGNDVVYRFSLEDIDPSTDAFIAIKISNVNVGVSMSFGQSSCLSCSPRNYGPFNVIGSSLTFPISVCDLPLNYKTTDWLLDIENNGLVETSYTLSITVIKFSSTIALTAGTGISQTLTSQQLRIFTWDVPDVPETSVVNTQILFSFTSVVRTNILIIPSDTLSTCFNNRITIPLVSPFQFEVRECCLGPKTYFIVIFNYNDDDVSFDIAPKREIQSDTTSITWNADTNSASSTITVPANDPNRNIPILGEPLPGPFYQEGRIQYPGSSIPNLYDLAIRVDTQTAAVPYYIERNGFAGAGGCFSSSWTGTNKIVLQQIACASNAVELNLPQEYWFGFSNPSTSPQDVTVSAKTHTPTPISLGNSQVSLQGIDREIEIWHQFELKYTLIPAPGRQLKISLTTPVESFQIAISSAGYAGDRTTSTCLNSNLLLPSLVTPAQPFQATLSLCALSTIDDIFIGIRAATLDNTQNASEFTLSVEYIDSQTATVVSFPGTTSLPTAFNVRQFNFTTPGDAESNGTLYYGLVTIDGVSTPSTLTYAKEGACSSLSAYRCFNNNTVCSAMIFPCDYYAPLQYIFTLTETTATPVSVVTSRMETTPISLSLPEANNVFSYDGTVNSNELKIFRISVTGDDFVTGETITFSVQNIICGGIEIYINKYYSAGPTCNLNSCTSNCNLYTINPCQLSEELLGDWFISVRGVDVENFDKPNVPAKFRVVITRESNFQSFKFHPNEIVSLDAVPEEVVSVCPASGETTVPGCEGCNSFVIDSVPYISQEVIWISPLDGAQFISNSLLKLQLSSYLSTATLHVQTELPNYCIPPTSVVSETCTPLFGASSCQISLDLCKFKGYKQLYVWIDNIAYFGGNSKLYLSSDYDRISLATIDYQQAPFAILDVPYSTEPSYLLYSLSLGEKQYFRVHHDPKHINDPDYLFSANHIRLNGGDVEFYNEWDSCDGSGVDLLPFCEDNGNCKDYLTSDQCSGTAITPCYCDFERYTCQPEYISEYSLFHIRASQVNFGVVVGKIQFEFKVPRYEISDICDTVEVNDVKHFIPDVDVNSEEIYFFSLFHQAGQNNLFLEVSEDDLAVPNTCAKLTTCTAMARTNCTVYFRERSDKLYLSVVSTARAGSSSTEDNFLLKQGTLRVYPVQLENSTISKTHTEYLDSATSCVRSNETDYFKYTSFSDAILVEIWSNNDGDVVYINKDHVTYEWGTWSCTTSGGYGQIFLACNRSQGLFYFHVVAFAEAEIRVTEYNTTVIDLSMGITESVVLDSNAPTSYKISVEPEADPTVSLFLSYNLVAGVSMWVTRGAFGDETCEVLLPIEEGLPVFDIIPSGYVIPGCRLLKDNHTYFANFRRTTSDKDDTCIYQTISLRADLQSRSATSNNSVVLVSSANTVDERGHVRMLFNLELDSNSIIYARFGQVLYGGVNALILKGNSIVESSYVIPSDHAGSCPTCSETINTVGWYDNCWHCEAIDTVYVDVFGDYSTLQRESVQFDLEVTTETWLSISSLQNFDLPGPNPSHAFYSAAISKDTGHSIQVLIKSGAIAKVEIFPERCSDRAIIPKVTLYCIVDAECSLFTSKSNFGNYTGTLRIVITGEDVEGEIKLVADNNLCSGTNSDNAPFCTNAGYAVTAFGDGSTFKAKDLRAEEIFTDLAAIYSNLGCQLTGISDDCILALEKFSCQIALPACSSGFAVPPSYSTCLDVEEICGASLLSVGRPALACSHNFYDGGIKWVGPDDDDTPSNNISGPQMDPLLWLWILIAIILFIILVVIIVAIVRRKESTKNDNYNMQQFGPKDGQAAT